MNALALLAAAMLSQGGYLDPAQARDDAPEILRENRAFCKEPARPLSNRARELCSVAERLPDCEGFRAACAEERRPVVPDKPSEPPSELTEALKKALGQLAHALIWILIAAVAAAVLFPLIAGVLRRRKDKALAEARGDAPAAQGAAAPETHELLSEDDANLLLQRAADHERQGNLSAALFTYLNASLRALDKRGAIRIARYRTNGEYVRACNDAAAKEPLRAIVREVDQVQFGGMEPTRDMIAQVASRATGLVRSSAVLAGMLLVLSITGCGLHFPRQGGRASDPAGHEILTELLARQDVTVGKLGSSLESVRIPQEDDREPSFAILIDTDRTILETAIEEHLMRWVQAGGFLVLAGSPVHWPDDLGAIAENGAKAEIETDTTPSYRATLASPSAVRFPGLPTRRTLAHTTDGRVYAAFQVEKKGKIIVIASSDLLTNAQLAQPDNAAAIVAILNDLDRSELRIAHPEDGISPPPNPIAALERAGLGLPLYHALAATLVLFVAVGIRLSRARATPPPLRRAFTEHIEATGAFYHRRQAATHALAAYARYAEERVRQRIPRGTHDIGAWLGQRSGVSAEECSDIWQRATNVHAFAVPKGDELFVLKRLSAIVSAALRMGN